MDGADRRVSQFTMAHLICKTEIYEILHKTSPRKLGFKLQTVQKQTGPCNVKHLLSN